MELFTFDAEYVRRLCGGESPIEDHFIEYFTTLLTIKLRKAGLTRNVIDDVIQETFARVFAKLHSSNGVRQPERIGAFVFGVCNNVLHELYRDGRRVEPLSDIHSETIPSKDDVYVDFVSAEDVAQVRRILAELSERDRRILNAIFIDERPKDEVCAEMNVDRQYLRVLVHRAKNDFRSKYLKKKEDE